MGVHNDATLLLGLANVVVDRVELDPDVSGARAHPIRARLPRLKVTEINSVKPVR